MASARDAIFSITSISPSALRIGLLSSTGCEIERVARRARPASSRAAVSQRHRHSSLREVFWHRRSGSLIARRSHRADARRWLRRTGGRIAREGVLMTAAGDPTSLAGAIWRLKSDPASTVIRPCPTPARSTARCDVEAATFDQGGSPPITCITVPTCRAHTPMDWNGRMCRLLPRPRGLPRYSGGSASMTSLSRPAQASLTLRPAGLLDRPMAAFVTRLRPAGLPRQAARLLPGPTDNFLGGSFLHW